MYLCVMGIDSHTQLKRSMYREDIYTFGLQ
jgi:hypothetical protein